jgi:hypothetical protein
VPVLEQGRIRPLSGGNNVEIRVLKEKHRALWQFLVLVDRARWDRAAAAGEVAREFFGIDPAPKPDRAG